MTMDELVISYKQGDGLDGLCFISVVYGNSQGGGGITKHMGTGSKV